MAEEQVKKQENTEFEKTYIDENIQSDKDGRFKSFLKKFLKRKTAVAGLIIIFLLVIIAIIGPYVTPYDYTEYDYANTLAGPSAKHWFGTDNYGRDILSRMLVGTRLTLGVALSSVVVGAALGSIPTSGRVLWRDHRDAGYEKFRCAFQFP